MASKNLLSRLLGGDRRSIGRADSVAAEVLKDPRSFPELIDGLWSDNRLVRMRAADVVEKETRKNPQLLAPYKKDLLELLAETEEQELRWHLAAIVPRLQLSTRERDLAWTLLQNYLKDRSSIVKTSALQGLADLAWGDAKVRPRAVELLREAARSGTPAMKARSRKLLVRLRRM